MARRPLTARVRRILNDQRRNQGAQKAAMMSRRKEKVVVSGPFIKILLHNHSVNIKK